MDRRKNFPIFFMMIIVLAILVVALVSGANAIFFSEKSESSTRWTIDSLGETGNCLFDAVVSSPDDSEEISIFHTSLIDGSLSTSSYKDYFLKEEKLIDLKEDRSKALRPVALSPGLVIYSDTNFKNLKLASKNNGKWSTEIIDGSVGSFIGRCGITESFSGILVKNRIHIFYSFKSLLDDKDWCLTHAWQENGEWKHEILLERIKNSISDISPVSIEGKIYASFLIGGSMYLYDGDNIKEIDANFSVKSAKIYSIDGKPQIMYLDSEGLNTWSQEKGTRPLDTPDLSVIEFAAISDGKNVHVLIRAEKTLSYLKMDSKNMISLDTTDNAFNKGGEIKGLCPIPVKDSKRISFLYGVWKPNVGHVLEKITIIK